ncbi:MAG: DUF4340 domain-containing protein [Myxococcaceae bacterium]|nr:DUF4340 domain-containing protein [Myxococcaceae bacterium]
MNKPTLIAVAVFAMLLAVVLATRETQVSEGMATFRWKPIERAAITRLELTGANTALLVKSPSGWTVADPAKPADAFATDEAQVNALLDAVAGLKVKTWVTSKKERHAELEVDEAKAATLTVSGDQGVLGTVLIGKPSQSGGRYVRAPGQDDVFAADGALAYAARKDVAGFRKRALVSLKAEDLVGLEVKKKDQRVEVTLRDGAWTLESPAPAKYRFDPQAAAQLARAFAGLSAQDFAKDAAADTSATEVTARAKDGAAVTVRLGVESNGTVPLRLENDAQVYLVPAYQAQQLSKTVEDLRDLRLWSYEAAKAKRLRVTAGTKAVTVEKRGEAWAVTEPKAAPADFDPAQVPVVLAQLAGLRATRLDESPAAAKACRAAATATVELTLEDQSRRALRFGGELGPNEVCVQGSEDALTYAAPRAMRARFEDGAALFKRPPPRPPMGSGAIQGLEQLPPDIRAKLEAQLRAQMQQPPQ